MSSLTKRANPNANAIAVMVGIATIIGCILLVSAAATLGNAIVPAVGSPIHGFSSLASALEDGTVPWSPASTVILLLELGALVAATWWVLAYRRRIGATRTRVDKAAPLLAGPKDLHAITEAGAAAKAKELGVEGFVGLPVGETLIGKVPLYASVEDLIVAIWGPRAGKTTTIGVPCMLSAPGALISTSNKRDLVDATRDVRAERGLIWVFDPQQVANERPTWWWNPLSYVTDGVTAAKLAEHFANGSRAGNARVDSYFDPAGQKLLAGLLLAAAIGNHPITRILYWLANPTKCTDAVELLQRAGFAARAEALDATTQITPKQRDGIFGAASQMAACLENEAVVPWITRTSAFDARPQLTPAQFVRSTDSLYLLSMEGVGTASPIVTALTAAVIESAEDYAKTQPGGRLAVPLIAVLDEAANVCRWTELPNLYSHFGSRGILLVTILQSWSQGVEVWGQEGMKKLWGAANVKSYGGGSDDVEFCEMLSKLVGDYEYTSVSTSFGPGGRSTTTSRQLERVFDVKDIAGWPRHRAIIKASGMTPTIVRNRPWMTGPYAAAVRASKKRNEALSTHPPKDGRAQSQSENPWLTGGPR